MSKQQKVKVELTVQVPEGTSKTKVEKTLSTLLKSGTAPEGFKLGAPKVIAPQANNSDTANTTSSTAEPALA